MKKILSLVIVLGFVIMLGAAGSVEYVNMGFVKALLMEMLGMAVVLSGISAMMHYKRYERRMLVRRRLSKRVVSTASSPVGAKIVIPEKELC